MTGLVPSGVWTDTDGTRGEIRTLPISQKTSKYKFRTKDEPL